MRCACFIFSFLSLTACSETTPTSPPVTVDDPDAGSADEPVEEALDVRPGDAPLVLPPGLAGFQTLDGHGAEAGVALDRNSRLRFDRAADGSELRAGTVLNQPFEALGLQVSCTNAHPRHEDRCLVFDSSSPTGGDWDLGTPHQDFGGPGRGAGGAAGSAAPNRRPLGNLLIVGESTRDRDADGLVDDPSDEPRGGTITFEFEPAVIVRYVTIVDIDSHEESFVRVAGADGSESTFRLTPHGDNSVQELSFDPEPIRTLTVELAASGAVGEIALGTPLCTDETLPTTDCPDGLACDAESRAGDDVLACRLVARPGMEGDECSLKTHCAPGFTCLSYSGADSGTCYRFCEERAECGGGTAACQSLAPVWPDLALSRCTVSCQPGSTSACPTGEQCHPFRNPANGDFTDCTPVGVGGEGDRCSNSLDCSAGLTCVNFRDGRPDECRTVCQLPLGAECSPGFTCRNFEGGFNGPDGGAWGSCTPD